MLVLTRKATEEILIGDDIKITLVRIRGNSVRVGIEAPRDVRVVRAEIRDANGEKTNPKKTKPSNKRNRAEQADAETTALLEPETPEQDVSQFDRPGMELHDREAVFAHPQKKRPIRKPRRGPATNRGPVTNRLATNGGRAVALDHPAVDRQIVVGTSSPDGRVMRLHSESRTSAAPLSAFTSAP